MKGWLFLVAVFLLWPGFSSQNACEEPDEIDFGEIVSAEKAKYLENDRVQYRCNPSYVLEGPEWIQCKGQEWTPRPPKCLAPCSITRQQLATKNLFVTGSQRKAQLIQSNQSLQFQCNEGYVLVVPSVRKCIDGYMDLPLCISERGKNCGDPPRIENGDIIPLSEKQYISGTSVEFRCQKNYAMEGQNRSFCDNGTWTKVPVCLGKGCDYIRIENGRMADSYEQYRPFPKLEGETIRFYCYHGFLPIGKQKWQTATCINSRFEPELKCFKICDPSRHINKGHFASTSVSTYIEGENITFVCDEGYSPANQQSTITCTKNGWSPAPRCVLPPSEGGCGLPPAVDNGDIVGTPKETYLQSEDVLYLCQNFYRMEGSPRVTCQNGRWSQTPTCRVPCTTTEDDMSEHNIRLKWSDTDKLYSVDGDVVEFICRRGYKPHPNTSSFRATCVNGKFDFPDCIPI